MYGPPVVTDKTDYTLNKVNSLLNNGPVTGSHPAVSLKPLVLQTGLLPLVKSENEKIP